MANITSKQRAIAAFEHREEDRIPLFDQTVGSDVASKILGREAFTGTTLLHYQEACAWMDGDQAHDEFVEKMYNDVIDISKELSFDILRLPWRNAAKPDKQIDEHTFIYGDPEGDHSLCKYDPSSMTFGAVRHIRKEPVTSPDQLEPFVEETEHSAEEFSIDDPYEHFEMLGRQQKEYGDEFLVTGGGGIQIPLEEEWLLACGLRPDLVERLLDAQLKRTYKQFEALAKMDIKVIWGGGDFADKNGPVYGPVVFREIFFPRLKKMIEKCNELELYYVFRSDGNLWPVEEEFFEKSGIHGYGEIDYEAGMKIPELKEKYGGKITFWGNVPTGSIMVNGTPEEVKEFTKNLIDGAAGDGGFILGSSNCIMPTTPPENLLAMIETGLEYGKY